MSSAHDFEIFDGVAMVRYVILMALSTTATHAIVFSGYPYEGLSELLCHSRYNWERTISLSLISLSTGLALQRRSRINALSENDFKVKDLYNALSGTGVDFEDYHNTLSSGGTGVRASI